MMMPWIFGNRKFEDYLTTLLLFVCGLAGRGDSTYIYDENNLIHINSFKGAVGAGNFTYYRLALDGFVIIRLESVSGDADLYVSSSTMHPTWDQYDMKSMTCGTDETPIDPGHERPVGIGVYGYGEDKNIFTMTVYLDPTYKDPYPEVEMSEKYNILAGEKLPPISPGKQVMDAPKDNEESLLWTLFVGFLKILFDVLL